MTRNRLMLFQGPAGGWHWRFLAGNNRTIAIGAEPFSSKSSAKRAFFTLKREIGRFAFYGLGPEVTKPMRPQRRRRR